MNYSFNDLVTTCIKDGKLNYLFAVDHLLRPGQKKIVEFIREYTKNYSKIPTVEIVRRNLEGIYVPERVDLEEDAGFVFKNVVDALKSNFLSDNWNGVVENGLVNSAYLSDLMKRSEIPSLEVLDYGDYDRSVHFRDREIRKTGIKWFDDAGGGGIDSSDYLILYGRLKSGKTTVLTYLTFSLLLQRYRTHFYSNELSKLQIAGRIDAFMEGFNPRQIRNGQMNDETKERLLKLQKSGQYRDLLKIYGTVSSVEEIIANVNSSKEKPDFVIIDSANLMGRAATTTSEKSVSLGEISRNLKLFALNTKIPVIITTQEKRSSGAGERENADASLIAESDNFGRDADLAIRVSPFEQETRNFIRLQVSASRHAEIIDDQFLSIDYDTMTVTHHNLIGDDDDCLIEERINAVSNLLGGKFNSRVSSNDDELEFS